MDDSAVGIDVVEAASGVVKMCETLSSDISLNMNDFDQNLKFRVKIDRYQNKHGFLATICYN